MLVSMKEYMLSKIAYVFGFLLPLSYCSWLLKFCFVPGVSTDFPPDYRKNVLP